MGNDLDLEEILWRDKMLRMCGEGGSLWCVGVTSQPAAFLLAGQVLGLHAVSSVQNGSKVASNSLVLACICDCTIYLRIEQVQSCPRRLQYVGDLRNWNPSFCCCCCILHLPLPNQSFLFRAGTAKIGRRDASSCFPQMLPRCCCVWASVGLAQARA